MRKWPNICRPYSQLEGVCLPTYVLSCRSLQVVEKGPSNLDLQKVWSIEDDLNVFRTVQWVNHFVKTTCTSKYVYIQDDSGEKNSTLRGIIIGNCEKINFVWTCFYSLRAGRSGDRNPVGARFFALVQTDPGAHPDSYKLGIGGKAAGAWHWLPTPI